ncbi:DUF2283 domain-containing protein [Gloeocapsopsis crepidinum LEGE 06123]|uniref:DUF2283 domain-containing protein n=1 Tax=Gloeocapsopsis crepidinum LEGE 06123 TaxID=588587 RepID=A0ABR9UZ99_9CHRO|nr:DUF2283 domain-containing protein [Gloeocapsopsis crepidinum]MBE9193654.1 DUF2283 domain-containing protein [Gloeocapsopsis crepidinum LEGE 06123]
MKAHYDPQADALAINWGDAAIEESEEVEPGVILDYDKDGNVIGVEVLNASKKIDQLEGKPLLITSLDQITPR